MSPTRHALRLAPYLLLLAPRLAAAEPRDAGEMIHGIIFFALVGCVFLVLLAFGLWLLWVGLRAERPEDGPQDLRPTLERLYAPVTDDSVRR